MNPTKLIYNIIIRNQLFINIFISSSYCQSLASILCIISFRFPDSWFFTPHSAVKHSRSGRRQRRKNRGAAVFQAYRGVDLPAACRRVSSVRMMSRSSSAQAGTGSLSRRAQRLGNHLIIAHPVGSNVLQNRLPSAPPARPACSSRQTGRGCVRFPRAKQYSARPCRISSFEEK